MRDTSEDILTIKLIKTKKKFTTHLGWHCILSISDNPWNVVSCILQEHITQIQADAGDAFPQGPVYKMTNFNKLTAGFWAYEVSKSR